MANTENIEAKLAAYVEGELDAGERAEIEKHLATNPQHQALLAELQKMRNVVRELPRESAPPEIFERVQQQIERSLLLGESSEAIEPVRMKRGPSFLLAASITFLALGLGAVIYFALPGRSQPNVIAMKPPVPASATTSPTTAELAMTDMKSAVEAAPTDTERPAAGAPGLPPPVAAAPGLPAPVASAPPERRETFAGKGGGPRENETFHDRAGGAKSITPLAKDVFDNNERMYVVVDSANPTETAAGLNTYLATNNFSWQVDAEPMPEPIEVQTSNTIAMSRMRQQNVQVKESTTAGLQSQAQTQASADKQAEQRILVRNVTRAQVSELNDVLTKSGARQQAQFITNRADNTARSISGWPEQGQNAATTRELDAPNQSATTQPTLQPGETLSVTVDQLVGPGVDKTNTVRVNDDGTIALPMVEPIRVAGLDEAQVKEKIAGTYRDAQLIASPTVTMTKLAAATQPAQAALPTTQPAKAEAQQELGELQQAVQQAAPTTQPTDKVDVVIVVQSAAAPEAAPPASQPTTQPAVEQP